MKSLITFLVAILGLLCLSCGGNEAVSEDNPEAVVTESVTSPTAPAAPAENREVQTGTRTQAQVAYYPYGYNPYGYNPYGYNPYGYNPYGYNPYGYNPYGYNPYGYNPYGYNPYGYNPYGYGPVNCRTITNYATCVSMAGCRWVGYANVIGYNCY
jgi:hypothetical protein